MVWLKGIIDFWFRAAALIFTGAVVLVCSLLLISSPKLLPLGLVIITLLYWRRQLAADQQPPHSPDLIDRIGQGVTGLLALVVAGIGLVLALALLLRLPWLIIFGLLAFWILGKSKRRLSGS